MGEPGGLLDQCKTVKVEVSDWHLEGVGARTRAELSNCQSRRLRTVGVFYWVLPFRSLTKNKKTKKGLRFSRVRGGHWQLAAPSSTRNEEGVWEGINDECQGRAHALFVVGATLDLFIICLAQFSFHTLEFDDILFPLKISKLDILKLLLDM